MSRLGVEAAGENGQASGEVSGLTVGDLFRLAAQRWLVSLAAITCIALMGLWAMDKPMAYNGRVSVIFLAPTATDGNVLAGTTAALVATAGVVAGQVNGADPQAETVGDVTLSSMGVRSGWSVRQPNNGGQWVMHFSDPLLDVRSTGPDLPHAQQQMQAALGKVRSALAQLQDDAAVTADMRITTILSPAEPVYTVQAGSRLRTIGAVGLLGLLGWATALLVVDRSRPRRAQRAPAPSGAAVGDST